MSAYEDEGRTAREAAPEPGEAEAPREGEEEEWFLLREEGAPRALETFSVPEVCGVSRLIRERFEPSLLQELNLRLCRGELSELLGAAVVTERLTPREMSIGAVSCWRLNQTDFLADVTVSLRLRVARGEQLEAEEERRVDFCVTLWFNTDEGFRFEMQELSLSQSVPDRSFWKLDEYLIPILREDEIEQGADRIWENRLPQAKDPKERTARMLAEAMGLTVRELHLHGHKNTRAVLFFEAGDVSVQEEKQPLDEAPPPPVPVRVEAGTIVLNTAARSYERDLDILHECVHYEWHLLFYRLQKLISTSPLELRYREVQASPERKPRNPLKWMERQADRGALALLLPRRLMREKAWRLFQQASTYPALNGYFNHPGFRWQRVIHRMRDEYRVGLYTLRRRLTQLGYTDARGAVNHVDGHLITPFAFTEENPGEGRGSWVIGRKDMMALYRRSRAFREVMSSGSFVWVDGHVCLNDPQYLTVARQGARLTAWANAHVDLCCLWFQHLYDRKNETSPLVVFGRLNSDGEYLQRYNEYLDSRMSLSPAQRIARREAFMREMPNSFSDALRYVMAHRDGGAITLEELAAAAQISRKTVERYRSREQNAYDPDKVVALCIALHLPPWLSRILLDKARVTVRNWGPTGYLGEILDCCFMDTIPQVQQYLREAGYPPLKLQEA